MPDLQGLYARLSKIAENELCHGCGEKPITDIWHSLCNECAIHAEQVAYDSLSETKIEGDE